MCHRVPWSTKGTCLWFELHLHTCATKYKSTKCYISDVRVQERVAAAQQQVVDAPTIENCTRLLNCALDECEAKGKPVPLALQTMTRRILLFAQKQQLNEQTNADDNEEDQPRRKKRKGVTKIQYLDTAKTKKTKTITRSCKPNASPRIQQQHIRRITKEIDDEITERLGVNMTVMTID